MLLYFENVQSESRTGYAFECELLQMNQCINFIINFKESKILSNFLRKKNVISNFVKRSRFLAAVKTHLGIYFGQAVAMRIMIKATGCPAPMLDRGTGFLFEEPNPEREP